MSIEHNGMSEDQLREQATERLLRVTDPEGSLGDTISLVLGAPGGLRALRALREAMVYLHETNEESHAHLDREARDQIMTEIEALVPRLVEHNVEKAILMVNCKCPWCQQDKAAWN